MSVRALIIAIEEYPRIQGGFSPRLDGTLDAARQFRQWLIHARSVRPKDIHFCSWPCVAESTHGASRQEIADAIAQLVREGRDRTGTLFVYFAGHGFHLEDIQQGTDVLVAADFCSPETSGNACLRLDELQLGLRRWLGSGESSDHFYFIDACRHRLSRDVLHVGGLGLALRRSSLGEPSVYTLQSTSPGGQAAMDSGFQRALIEGLNGAGRAKAWLANAPVRSMVVHFQSLRDYLIQCLPGQTPYAETKGNGHGILRTFDPTPRSDCRITIVNGAATDLVEVEIHTAQGIPLPPHSFRGTQRRIALVPNDYDFQVRIARSRVLPMDPLPADLFEDREIRFRKQPMPRGSPPVQPAPVSQKTRVTAHLPEHVTLTLIHSNSGEQVPFSGNESLPIAPGIHELQLSEPGSGTLLRDRFSVEPGGHRRLDFARHFDSPLRTALRHGIHARHEPGTMRLAPSIGGTADPDLGVWLSVAGASRVLGDLCDGEFLAHLPLRRCDGMQRDESCLYVLAGFDDGNRQVTLGLGDSGGMEWIRLNPVAGFPGLHETRTAIGSGGHLLSIQIEGAPPVCMGTYAAPGHATLVIITCDGCGASQVRQMVLPEGSLFDTFPAVYRKRIRGHTSLRIVKAAAQAWRTFLSRRRLLGEPFTERDIKAIEDGSWPDPILAAMIGYEFLRRGQRERLAPLLAWLGREHPGLPDLAVLTRLARRTAPRGGGPSPGIPLFADGWAALTHAPARMPKGTAAPDLDGVWTSWRGSSGGSPQGPVTTGTKRPRPSLGR